MEEKIEFELIDIDEFYLYGNEVELTQSQNTNYGIIRDAWMKLNAQLRESGLSSNGNWEKFGLTYKKDGLYFYAPSLTAAQSFETRKICIPQSSYAKFEFHGHMSNMKDYLYALYKEIIPNSELLVDQNREIIQFERYDKRFNFSGKNSVIDIFIPIL